MKEKTKDFNEPFTSMTSYKHLPYLALALVSFGSHSGSISIVFLDNILNSGSCSSSSCSADCSISSKGRIIFFKKSIQSSLSHWTLHISVGMSGGTKDSSRFCKEVVDRLSFDLVRLAIFAALYSLLGSGADNLKYKSSGHAVGSFESTAGCVGDDVDDGAKECLKL